MLYAENEKNVYILSKYNCFWIKTANKTAKLFTNICFYKGFTIF